MTFDMKKVLEEMVGAAGQAFAGEWPKVQGCVTAALKDEQEALEAIATARFKKQINDAEMKSQLDDEKETLKVALLACEVKAKIAAQEAANAAINALTSAIKIALKAV